jgi:hypothetical protein
MATLNQGLSCLQRVVAAVAVVVVVVVVVGRESKNSN